MLLQARGMELARRAAALYRVGRAPKATDQIAVLGPLQGWTVSGNDVLARVQRIEDIQAVADVKAAYCNAADGGWDRPSHDAEAVAELFVADGVWDGGTFGRADGRDAIRHLFEGFGRFPFAFHCISNPIIRVDGDIAHGQWHANIAITLGGDRSHAMGAIYDDTFERTDAGWKLRHLRAIPVYGVKVPAGFRVGP